MNAGDYVALVIIVAVVGAAVAYIVRSKKKGKKCIGCPGGCSGSCNCNKK